MDALSKPSKSNPSTDKGVERKLRILEKKFAAIEKDVEFLKSVMTASRRPTFKNAKH